MQYKIDDITVEIIKPTQTSSPDEDIKRAAAFIYKIAEINLRAEKKIYKIS